MTKKGRSKKKHIDTESESDEVRSVVSNDTAFSRARSEFTDDESSFSEKNPDEVFSDNIENLTEKRSSVRIDALEKVYGQLLLCLTTECLEQRRDTLVSSVLNCLRKPTKQEGILASRCLAVISITLGPDEDSLFCELQSILENLVKNSVSDEVQSAAIEALSMCCFMCATEEDHLLSTLELAATGFTGKASPAFCSTSLQCWGFLSTILPLHYLAGECYERYMPIFIKLLDHIDPDVRASAGENIALLFEVRLKTEDTTPEKSIILRKVEELIKTSSKRNSKKDRKEQRCVFRDIQRTIADQVEPEVKLTIVHELLTFSSWRQIKQLSAVKNSLRTGFHEHIQYNSALRRVFSLSDASNRPARLTANEKRTTMSKNSSVSKQRAHDRTRSRNTKREYQNMFYDNE